MKVLGKIENTETRSSGIDANLLPKGTTAQRPSSPVAGDYRYNTDLGSFEGYNGSIWVVIGGIANVTDVSVGSTLTANQSNNYIRLDAVTNQDFTITTTTLEINQMMTFRAVDVGLPNLLVSGVTINDPNSINGTVTNLGLIKVGATEYDLI